MVGAVTLPYFALELYAPALEVLGWLTLPLLWWLDVLPDGAIALFVAISILLSSSVSFAAILLDALFYDHFRRARDRAKLVAVAIGEHFGYRQCTIYYRLRGFYRYYRSVHLKSSWTSPARAGAGAA